MRQANAWRMGCSRVVGRLVSHAGDGLRPALGVSRTLNCTLRQFINLLISLRYITFDA